MTGARRPGEKTDQTTEPALPMIASFSHRLCVAPMLDWTDRHCRSFLRVLAPRAWLYTEMVVAQAIVHGEASRLLDFSPEEHPLALQLGGSEPELLAAACRRAADWAYDEINLNLGCPSDRVQSGRFGAVLMKDPDTVAACLRAMRQQVDVPVTAKIRIGVDEHDSDEWLHAFVAMLEESGVQTVVVHARKAWLKGLSPKENREVPTLQYERVERLQAAFPCLQIVLNGGIETLEQARHWLERFPGIMLGRAAYHNPWLLSRLHRRIWPQTAVPASRKQAVEAFLPYVERQCSQGVSLSHISRHMLGLFQGLPGARRWRRMLTEQARQPGAGPELLLQAMASVQEEERHEHHV